MPDLIATGLEELMEEVVVGQYKEICRLRASLYRGQKLVAVDSEGVDISAAEADKWEKRANA